VGGFVGGGGGGGGGGFALPAAVPAVELASSWVATGGARSDRDKHD
jgi:hypothetical protein